MSEMTIHILNAQKTLSAHCEWFHACLNATYSRAQEIMPVPSMDVVIKAGRQVIPEKGYLGFCPEPGLIYLTVDPTSPVFGKNEAQSFERMFAHELHHAARWAGPGYGSTLGEAVVSEGLAGHFALELFGGDPELWESLSPEILRAYSASLRENWHRADYDHNRWFFGAGDLPRWLGYSAGFDLIARYLVTAPSLRASMLKDINANELMEWL